MRKSFSYVRITSGMFRGRKITTPGNPAVHPMGDREKLALFNTLGPFMGSERILDCYCGSGALGLEALSRGASSAVFVDKDTRTVIANIKTLGLESRSEVVKCDASTFTSGSGAFDIILLDPPYDDFHPEDFEHLADFLKPGGRLVLSHPGEVDPGTIFKGLTHQKTKKFARCHLSFYTK